MKNIFVFSLPLILGVLACKTPSSNKKMENNKTPKGDTISLSALSSPDPVKVKTGQYLKFSLKEHASVGLGSKCVIKEEGKAIRLEKSDRAYKNPNFEKEPLAGGDEATRTYVFYAFEKGSNSITVEEWMRGTKENSFDFNIVVE